MGAAGQGADLISDYGKAAALLAGTGGFDGGVKGQQVGLFGNLLNHLQHRADVLALAVQFLDDAGGALDILLQLLDGIDRLLGNTGAVGAFLQRHIGGRYGIFGAGGDAAGGRFHLFHG